LPFLFTGASRIGFAAPTRQLPATGCSSGCCEASTPAVRLLDCRLKMASGEVCFLHRMAASVAAATSDRHMVLIWLLTLCQMQAIAQTVPVHTVMIKSVWGGLSPSPPSPVELLILRQGDNHFYSNGIPVSASLIEALVQALGAATVDQPQSSNLGITQRWLEDNVEDARRRNDPLSRYSSDFYRPAFEAAFTNRSLIETTLPSLFSGMHTDDYPGVDLQVVFANGGAWSAASDSQYEFMIRGGSRCGEERLPHGTRTCRRLSRHSSPTVP